MATTRPAAVAGMFYPAAPDDCAATIQQLLAENPIAAGDGFLPKALIVPHAGYIYAGAIAARAYNLLARQANRIERVILLGPNHRVPLGGIAAPSQDYFATPLGAVAIDRAGLDALADMPQVKISDLPHDQEHCLEVHLPFLQTVLHTFRLVPLVVGDATAIQVAQVLDRLWGGDETLVLISSDLSHYLSYSAAREQDTRTTQAIKQLDWHIEGNQACGYHAVNGLLYTAAQRGMQVRTLALQNSGDTAGDKQQVVGYGAYVIQ